MAPINEHRCFRLIRHAIETFNLDLSGLIVLTEAASNYYMFTPLIAAMAGAKKVLAITRDSDFGQTTQIQDAILSLAFKWKVKDRIEILFSKKDPRISEADIITNLGFVRPLDAPFLHRLKPSAVIPLMWETWEFRSTDLDLAESIRQGIMVLGTNEDHPDLQQFHYVGSLAKKLLFEMDIEVFHSQIVLVGGGKFGTTAYHSLCASGANVYQIRPAYGDSLNNTTIKMHLADCDAIVFVEHQYSEKLIGDGGQITAQELHSLNPGIVVVHIAGNVDYKDLTHLKIPIRPFRFSSHGYMSVTTAYLGPKPLIQLHSAGLKVGEAMARARLAGLDCKTAAELALKDSPAMDFSPQQKKIS